MYTKSIECHELSVEEVISLLSSYDPKNKLYICGSPIYYVYSDNTCVSLDHDNSVDCCDNILVNNFNKEDYPNPSIILSKILKYLYQPDEFDILKDQLLNDEGYINFSIEEINYMDELLKQNI